MTVTDPSQECEANPLITCLCLTRNRREWLPKAIACFLAQTYEPKELLIVADGDDVSDLAPEDPRVRLVCVGARLTIGAKRNYGCDLARGEMIAHWDDDDWSAPGRLVDQYQRIEWQAVAVTGYSTMRFTDGARWWQYTPAAEDRFAVGASLLYRKDWWASHRFLNEQAGEDNAFVAVAWGAGELATAPAGDLMYATIHEGNTSKRKVGGWNFKEIATA